MNFVEPIRDKKQLEDMKEELKKSGTRNYMLFITGINSALRISDLLKLNVDDVRNYVWDMRSHINLVEIKTKKNKSFPLANNLLYELDRYTKNMKPGEYLFASQVGENKPITETQAYRIIVAAAQNIKLDFPVGTHTMRKTFGYHHYQQFHDIAILQQIFNHSSPSITMRYLGLNQDEIDKSYYNFSL